MSNEIRSIRPEYCAILIRPDLVEQNRIAKGLEDWPEEPRGEISFSAPAMLKQHAMSAFLASTDTRNSIYSFTPAAR